MGLNAGLIEAKRVKAHHDDFIRRVKDGGVDGYLLAQRAVAGEVPEVATMQVGRILAALRGTGTATLEKWYRRADGLSPKRKVKDLHGKHREALKWSIGIKYLRLSDRKKTLDRVRQRGAI